MRNACGRPLAAARAPSGEPGNATQEQFTALVKSDYDRFGRLIKDANVKIEQ